jgi:hypothetical protein
MQSYNDEFELPTKSYKTPAPVGLVLVAGKKEEAVREGNLLYQIIVTYCVQNPLPQNSEIRANGIFLCKNHYHSTDP